jgi:hypothetical protein
MLLLLEHARDVTLVTCATSCARAASSDSLSALTISPVRADEAAGRERAMLGSSTGKLESLRHWGFATSL